MIVKSLQKHINALEEDCTKVMSKGNTVTKNLKRKKHNLCLKAHHTQKEIENDKLEIKGLKRNFEAV